MAGLEPAPARLSTARPHAPLAQARSRSIVRPRPSAVQRPAPQPHHSASRTFFMQKAAEQADAKASEPRSPPTSPNRRSTTSRRSSTSSWEKAAASLEGNRSVFDDDDAFYDKCAAANEASKSPKRQKPPLGKPKRAISPSAVPKPDPGGRLVTATPHRLLGSALSEDERPHDRLDDVRLCAGRSTGDWYTLQLKARPKAAVRISISSASDSVVVTPTNVFFAPDDWSKPRHVLVSARPAGDAPARHHKGAGAAHVKVFHYVISDDSNFHNAPLAPLIVHSLAGASDAVISFGAADDGQLGLGEFRPSSALRQLDSYHHVEIPHALSTEFHDMHRDAIEHAPAIQSVAARRENAAALEQLSGSAVVGDADFQAACKSSVYEDADATRAAHISSDSDIPRDGMKFDKYSSLTLSKRHDGSARNGGDRVLTLGGGARHSVVVTANGAMYTCGDNAQGQLGVGDTIQRRAMTRVVFAPMPEAPPRRDWASAARHGVAASFDKDRPVYDGGTPTSFADGRSPTSFADVASEKQTQTFADVAQKVRQRWLPRGSKRPPTKHALFSKHRVSVAVVGCGPGHTMAISIDGVLFSWGHNTNGQLGTGDTRDRYAPFKVELPGLGVVAATLVSCGAAHTICAGLEGEARSGVLYSWGSAVSGALGLGMLESEKDVLEPRLVAGMAGVAVHFLSCGSYHTALIDGDGDVFTCGLPEDGRLGRLCDGADDDAGKREERDSARSNAVFAKVLLPRDRRLAGARLKCIAVACGGSHTLLLASSRGVYACGDNARGQLGLGSRLGCRSKPQLVQMLCGRSICGLAAGATHSAAWTEAGLVYGWGEATCGQLGAKAEQGGAAVVMPNLLRVPAPSETQPVLSYARTRQLCFGGAHTLCVTEHSLHAVRRIVNSSRQFKIDAVKHLKMVAKYERFVDSSIIDPEAPKRQLSDADIGRNASQGDRRNWTRRCKLYKVVHFIDVEILINKVAQTKLIHAVQRAALAKVLHVKPAKHVYLRETAGLGKKGQAAKAQAADNFGAANEAGANEAFANKAVEAPAEPRRQRPSSAAPTAASAASKRPASARQAAARRQAAFQDEKTATKLRQANALTHRKADAAVTLACRLDRSDELLVQPVDQLQQHRSGARAAFSAEANADALKLCVANMMLLGGAVQTRVRQRAPGKVALVQLRATCTRYRAAFDSVLVQHVESLLSRRRVLLRRKHRVETAKRIQKTLMVRRLAAEATKINRRASVAANPAGQAAKLFGGLRPPAIRATSLARTVSPPPTAASPNSRAPRNARANAAPSARAATSPTGRIKWIDIAATDASAADGGAAPARSVGDGGAAPAALSGADDRWLADDEKWLKDEECWAQVRRADLELAGGVAPPPLRPPPPLAHLLLDDLQESPARNGENFDGENFDDFVPEPAARTAAPATADAVEPAAAEPATAEPAATSSASSASSSASDEKPAATSAGAADRRGKDTVVAAAAAAAVVDAAAAAVNGAAALAAAADVVVGRDDASGDGGYVSSHASVGRQDSVEQLLRAMDAATERLLEEDDGPARPVRASAPRARQPARPTSAPATRHRAAPTTRSQHMQLPPKQTSAAAIGVRTGGPSAAAPAKSPRPVSAPASPRAQRAVEEASARESAAARKRDSGSVSRAWGYASRAHEIRAPHVPRPARPASAATCDVAANDPSAADDDGPLNAQRPESAYRRPVPVPGRPPLYAPKVQRPHSATLQPASVPPVLFGASVQVHYAAKADAVTAAETYAGTPLPTAAECLEKRLFRTHRPSRELPADEKAPVKHRKKERKRQCKELLSAAYTARPMLTDFTPVRGERRALGSFDDVSAVIGRLKEMLKSQPITVGKFDRIQNAPAPAQPAATG